MGPATPYLLVDLPRLRANIDRAADRAQAAGVALRPHVKTHKTPQIAALQLEAGATGVTVATVAEAEVFVEHGAEDVFVAYPLWLDDDRAARLRRLTDRAAVGVGADSPQGAARLAEHLAGTGATMLVEVDSGHRRTGVRPEDAAGVADAARAGRLPVSGVFTFPGHAYLPEARQQAAVDEAAALGRAADHLRAAGHPVTVVSGGSTPSLEHADSTVLTEWRPGVYVFGDAQQWELGSMTPEQIALTCRTTVVSHAHQRVVVDAGSKALGSDRAPWATGFGRVLDHPAARVVQLSEHHAVVDLPGSDLPPLGSTLDLVPNHVCSAVNLADTLVVADGALAQTWSVAARGCNT